MFAIFIEFIESGNDQNMPLFFQYRLLWETVTCEKYTEYLPLYLREQENN